MSEITVLREQHDWYMARAKMQPTQAMAIRDLAFAAVTRKELVVAKRSNGFYPTWDRGYAVSASGAQRS